MPRCPDCNKFVSPDIENEPEEQDLSVDEDGQVTLSLRVHNDCPDCSTELAEYTYEFSEDAPDSDEIAKHQGDGHTLDVSLLSAERDDRYQTTTTDKKGNVKTVSPRYQKHFYIVNAEVEVTCSCGKGGPNDDGALFTLEMSDEAQASYFEQLV